MIEILDTTIAYDPTTNDPISRAVSIAITKSGQTIKWYVGGLPLTGDLQSILDAREAELWNAAQAQGKPHDLFTERQEKIIKAFALVVMDEINILRTRAGLQARTMSQIETTIKTKLKGL